MTRNRKRFWGAIWSLKTGENKVQLFDAPNSPFNNFYSEIIEGRYGLTVVPRENREYLNKGEINRIYLGDTRHYAMIEIIANGGTPTTAMLLAGQDEIATAAHYASNMEQYVKCATLRECRKVLGGRVSYNVSPTMHSYPAQTVTPLEGGGFCASAKYGENNYEDCLNALGSGGEIAYCPECRYYRNRSKSYTDQDRAKFRQKITNTCTYLKDALNLYRQGNGDKESLMRAIQDFQDSMMTYRKFCEERLAMQEEADNGQTETDQ